MTRSDMPSLGVRPLSDAERTLTRWMLEQAGPAAQHLLAQLEVALVSNARCSCGCATIYFDVPDRPIPTGGMHIVADFDREEGEGGIGVFVYEIDGVLGGVEVVGYGCDNPSVLPSIAGLRLI